MGSNFRASQLVEVITVTLTYVFISLFNVCLIIDVVNRKEKSSLLSPELGRVNSQSTEVVSVNNAHHAFSICSTHILIQLVTFSKYEINLVSVNYSQKCQLYNFLSINKMHCFRPRFVSVTSWKPSVIFLTAVYKNYGCIYRFSVSFS